MSFYLRKSIKVGPVRFNLSKSGVGVSTGFKGFRVGTGPRGNYIHMGVGGIYYRKTLSDGDRSTPDASDTPYAGGTPPQLPSPSVPQVRMTEIDSSDVSGMAHSSSAELLRELREKQKIARIGPWTLGGAIVLIVLALAAPIDPIFLPILGAGLAIGVFFAFRRDVLRKTVVLLYDFDPTLEEAFGQLHSSAMQLAHCAGCWHVAASGKVHDQKYHAGASELVSRKSTTVRPTAPAFLKTNIQTVAIGVGHQTMYFFPDRILVFDSGRVGAVGYDELRLSVSQTRFIENSAPHDARVVGQTWRYVNKKGGPDRRFSNNPQLPICLYDELHFSSASGLNEIVQLSKCGVGQAMEHSVRNLARFTRTA